MMARANRLVGTPQKPIQPHPEIKQQEKLQPQGGGISNRLTGCTKESSLEHINATNKQCECSKLTKCFDHARSKASLGRRRLQLLTVQITHTKSIHIANLRWRIILGRLVTYRELQMPCL
mmetsp:Transcript_12776/g.31372  ORF Transcript_12776/g.31372 Transcript_12776/m.31372 type:complete len:120 (+) Transcript_12776:1212-1571(+)